MRLLLEGRLGPALVLLGAVALAYCNSLSNSFHFDDQHSLVENPAIRQLANSAQFFVDPQLFSRTVGSEMYRPLVLLSYALNYQLGGYEVRGYRLANIGFHLGTAWLFCALLIRLGAARQLALLGALIFALHPLTAEPVNYISSRSESLAVLFLVAAFYFYAGAQKALSIPSLLCFALALLSKSVGLVLPGLLVLHEWSSGTGWWRRSARRQWPYWLLGAGYLLFTWRLIHEAVVQAPVRHWTAQLSTQIKALGYYLKLLVVPYPLSVEHQFFESSSFAESAPVLVLGLLASLALMGWRRLRGGDRRGIFWCAWCLLALLPTLVVPLNVLVSERRLYLVLAGFIGFSLWLIQQRLETKRVLSFGAVGVVILMLLTLQRNVVWRSEDTLWRDALEKAPQMVRPHLRMGVWYRGTGDLERAENAYLSALHLDPDNAPAHNNMGNLQRSRAQLDAAEQSYLKALAILPAYAEAMINLATLYSGRGQLDEALQLYQRALPLSGERAEIYNNMGTTYLRLKDFSAAERALRRALALRVGEAGIYRNLGGALEGQGRMGEALRSYERALQVEPGYAKAHYELGRLYEKMGRREAALRAYGDFLRYWRGEPEVAAQVRSKRRRLKEGADH